MSKYKNLKKLSKKCLSLLVNFSVHLFFFSLNVLQKRIRYNFINQNNKFSFKANRPSEKWKCRRTVNLPDRHSEKQDSYPIYSPILHKISLKLCKAATACFKSTFQKSLVLLKLNALHFVWKFC